MEVFKVKLLYLMAQKAKIGLLMWLAALSM